MRLDDLFLWYLGAPGRPRYVGELHLVESGKGVSLHYGAQWLAEGFALSEDLPLIDQEFIPAGRLFADAPRAVGAVDDARPDRWGEKIIRLIDRPKRLSLMEFLYFAGDDRFGALGVSTSPSEYAPRRVGPLPRLADAQALADVVAKIQAAEPISKLQEAMMRTGAGTGGAKPKMLIDIDGEPCLLKFGNGEPIDVPLVEHATMSLAQRAGIRVAKTMPVRLVAEHALAIWRFDRAPGRRIHAISASTAIRAAESGADDPALMGYPALAMVLRRTGSPSHGRAEQDAAELFRRMVFNILMDNTDDHEKNHSLLIDDPSSSLSVSLAPAYDVLPTNSGQGHQEFVCGDAGRDSTLDNAMSQCQAFGLTHDMAAAEVYRVIDVVRGWRQHFAQIGVTPSDIEALAEFIDGDALRSQREDFQSSPVRRRRKRSPFQPE